MRSRPASARIVATGKIVIDTWSLAGGQGRPAFALVSVSVTVPAAISPGDGV